MTTRRRALPAAAAAIIATFAIVAPAWAGFGQLTDFGGPGTGDGQVSSALFVALDTGVTPAQAYLGDYRTNTGNPNDETFRVVPFESFGGIPSALTPWGAVTESPYLSVLPQGGAIDVTNRRLYVSFWDVASSAGQNDVVGWYDLNAKPATLSAITDLPAVGSLNGLIGQTTCNASTAGGAPACRLGNPTSLAVVPGTASDAAIRGDIYVAGVARPAGGKPEDDVVRRFKPGTGGANSTFGASITGPFVADQGLQVAADPTDGSVWVLDDRPDDDPGTAIDDTIFGRVQHFTKNGTIIAADTITGSLDHPFKYPGNLAVDGQGRVYVDHADLTRGDPIRGGDGVMIWQKSGGSYAEFRRFGQHTDPLNPQPCDFGGAPRLAVTDSGDRIVAYDQSTRKAQVFGIADTATACPNSAAQGPQIQTMTSDPTVAIKGQPVKITTTATGSPAGGSLTYAWDLDNNGSYETTTFGAENFTSTTFATVGPRTIKVRVSDNSGIDVADTRTLVVNVTSKKPTASFTATPASVQTGQNVTFDASASSDTDGSVVKYEWDFGSGFQTAGVNVQRSFATPGTVTVKLRVTDSDGDVSTQVSKPVTVAAPAAPPPSGAGSTPPPPADTLAPTLSVGTAKSAKGGVTFRVGCPATETSCAVKVTLASAGAIAAGKKRRITLGTGSATVKGGSTALVTVKLGSVGKRALKKLKRIKAVAKISVTDAAGNTGTQTTKVTVTAART